LNVFGTLKQELVKLTTNAIELCKKLYNKSRG